MREQIPTVSVENTNVEKYSLLEPCKLSTVFRGDAESACDEMDLVPASPATAYDPERILANSAPPKRFCRTFWRSIAHRVLVRELKASRMME